jgi:aspartate/methionine/tyrosine aminotransferase
MIKIATYSIQQWLFDEAEGKFSIDLGESGIQFHHFHDIDLTENYDLNYSLDRGKLLLREQISNMYGVYKNNVVITNGAQEGLYLFYRSFLKSDDHVIVFSPGWQQSWEVPKTIGVQVSCINLKVKDYYRIDFNTLNKHINENTKLIILTNPCNPTGVSLSEEERKVMCYYKSG